MKIDPVLFILGIAGIVFALIRKDPFPVIYSVPFLFFLDYVGYAQFFHIIPLIPIFCISGAILIEGLPYAVVEKYNKYILKHRTSIGNKKKEKNIQKTLKQYSSNILNSSSTRSKHFGKAIKFPFRNLQFVIIAGIGIFGLVSTTMLQQSTLILLILQYIQLLSNN